MPDRTIARMEALCISAHRAHIRNPGSLLRAYGEPFGITGSVIVCLDGLAGVKSLHRGFMGGGNVEAVRRIKFNPCEQCRGELHGQSEGMSTEP